MEQNQTAHKATIVRIYEDERTKSNGKMFLLTEVKFTEGALAGKTYFAQRTLGENKALISVGQDVTCYLNLVKDDSTGKVSPFFEIRTGTTDSPESILGALGL